jgi:hypothetical protein
MHEYEILVIHGGHMKLHHMLVTSAASALLFSAVASAQTSPGSVPAQKQCSGLTGSALESCLKSAPGRSGDSTSRSDGRAPGSSEDAASRTGTPPGTSRDAPMSGANTPGGAAKGGTGMYK